MTDKCRCGGKLPWNNACEVCIRELTIHQLSLKSASEYADTREAAIDELLRRYRDLENRVSEFRQEARQQRDDFKMMSDACLSDNGSFVRHRVWGYVAECLDEILPAEEP